MTYRTENLKDIAVAIRELEDKITDYEWDGRGEHANALRLILDGYYKLQEQGELYIPEF